MRISDWSSDVCSSDLNQRAGVEVTQIVGSQRGQQCHAQVGRRGTVRDHRTRFLLIIVRCQPMIVRADELFEVQPGATGDEPQLAPLARTDRPLWRKRRLRSEEHTSELQSLMRISYAVFCLQKKTIKHNQDN